MYISQYELIVSWGVELFLVKEMKKHWIKYLLPVFEKEKDAKNFCWNDYITMSGIKNKPL